VTGISTCGKDARSPEYSSCLRCVSSTKNLWKFWVDKAIKEDVVAFFDDDACFSSTVVREDFFDVSGTKIIARGIAGRPRPLSNASNASATPLNFEQPVGLASVGSFMTVFPIVIWTEMIADMRAWVVHTILNTSVARHSLAAEKEQFWRAWSMLCKHTFGKLMEFTFLLNFAWSSPKWRGLYDWGSLEFKPTLAFAFHNTWTKGSRACPTMQQLAKWHNHSAALNFHSHFRHNTFFNATSGELHFQPTDRSSLRNPKDGEDEDLELTRPMIDQHWENVHHWGERGPLSHLQADAGIEHAWDTCFSIISGNSTLPQHMTTHDNT
jgi:hypothetical protein